MALQGGSLTSLLPPASRSQPQAIPTNDLQWRITSNDVPSLRAQHVPESICFFDQLGSSNSQRKRFENTGVSRRFPVSAPEPRDAERPCRSLARHITVPRVEHKSQEIYCDTPKENKLSGNLLGSMVKYKVTPRRKNNAAYQQNYSHGESGSDMSKRLTKSGWSHELRKFCDTTRKTPFSEPPIASEFPVRHASLPNISLTDRDIQRIGMVAPKLPPILADPLCTTIPLPDHGCIGRSLGCPAGWTTVVGNLDRSRKDLALQCERNDRCLASSSIARSSFAQFNSTSSMRQSHSCCLLEERGGHPFHSLIRSDGQNIRTLAQKSYPSDCLLHPRQIQQPCRQSVTSKRSTRMAPDAQMHGDDLQKVWNPCDRSIRIRESSRGTQLCDIRSERCQGSVSQCLFPNMELSTSVDIPASVPDSKGLVSPKLGDRSLPSSGAQVGTSFLAPGPEIPSNSSPVHSAQSGSQSNRPSNRVTTATIAGNDSGSLESWGWSRSLIDWNEPQLELLRAAWRPSTRKVYKVAWNRWLTWAREHSIDPKQPSGSILARFLADLHLVHKLSYNTVLLHKSVVATLCNDESAGQLSSHVLVKHVLKAISLKKPIVAQKPPIWDIDILATFLEKRIVNENSPFDVCRHTATLLLLCSGRRVHDLTLLTVGPNHFVEHNDSIVLWPVFGSKTDNANYRQSGWKLLKNDNSKNLNPVFWVKRTITVMNHRRKLSKCDNLFVNLRGQCKAASRTVIARWIKSVLTDAGIITSPGSMRSAVASKNWSNNCPMDEILARGNWRSSNTFAQFYRRELIPTSAGNCITRLFNSIR